MANHWIVCDTCKLQRAKAKWGMAEGSTVLPKGHIHCGCHVVSTDLEQHKQHLAESPGCRRGLENNNDD